MCCCTACSSHLTNCPLCRRQIEKVVKTFGHWVLSIHGNPTKKKVTCNEELCLRIQEQQIGELDIFCMLCLWAILKTNGLYRHIKTAMLLASKPVHIYQKKLCCFYLLRNFIFLQDVFYFLLSVSLLIYSYLPFGILFKVKTLC